MGRTLTIFGLALAVLVLGSFYVWMASLIIRSRWHEQADIDGNLPLTFKPSNWLRGLIAGTAGLGTFICALLLAKKLGLL